MSEIENLKIDDVEIWNSEDTNIGIRLHWSANLGFGEYTIGFYDNRWYIDDECMEDPKTRKFGKLLLATWLDSLKDNPKYDFGEYDES